MSVQFLPFMFGKKKRHNPEITPEDKKNWEIPEKPVNKTPTENTPRSDFPSSPSANNPNWEQDRHYHTGGSFSFKKKRNWGSKVLPTLLVGGIVAAIGGLGYSCGSKVITERNRTVNHSAQECETLVKNSYAYKINKIPLTWGDQFNILINGEKVGVIKEQVFTWGSHFDFYAGNEEKKIGSAQAKFFSWGLSAEVLDENDKSIGKLDEKVLKFLDPGHTIRVYDAQGQLLAVSNERALTWSHTTTIYDKNEQNTLGGTVKDYWWNDFDLTIYARDDTRPESLDRRLLLALISMEYQLDEKEKSSHSHSSSK
ncbi:hypothetical protein HY837_06315 [archaeon]|nr:hypothetical protein [archaeon]